MGVVKFGISPSQTNQYGRHAMSRRFLEVIGVAVVTIVVVVLLKIASVPVVVAQAPTTSATTRPAAKAEEPVPKTAWGEPDLQGIWTHEYQIPLQRPARYANKEFFTDEERVEIDRRRRGQQRLGDHVAPRGTVQDVGGAYNSVFMSQKHTGRRTSLIVDPLEGRLPPVTPAVQKRRAAIADFENALLQATDICKNKMAGCAGGKYGPPSPRRAETPPYYLASGARGGPAGDINRADGPEDRTLGERCMGARLPDFGSSTGFFPRIVQSPGFVSIYYDTGQGQGWQRVIPITTVPHLPPHVRQWWGDSRGRWEGNTLVVDVTNFTAKRDFQGSRENLHLVERFTRVDAKTLEYVVTMEDPTAWTRPWTVKQEWGKQDEQANRVYYEPRCHEGNYGMVALLTGARAEERAFAEGRGPDPATICSVGCGLGIAEENRDELRR